MYVRIIPASDCDEVIPGTFVEPVSGVEYTTSFAEKGPCGLQAE